MREETLSIFKKDPYVLGYQRIRDIFDRWFVEINLYRGHRLRFDQEFSSERENLF